MNVALRALAVGSVVVLAAVSAQAGDLSAPVIQLAQAQTPPATQQQPAAAKAKDAPKATDAKATDAKAADAKVKEDPKAAAKPKDAAKAKDAPKDAKAAAAAPAAAVAGAGAVAGADAEKVLPKELSGECAYTGKRIVGLLGRDDVDQARKFMDFYRLFGCQEAHIGPTFRCLINDRTPNATADDINARIDRCWEQAE